jgi:hypothetical protein
MMENPQSTESPPKKSKKFRFFAAKSIIIGTVGVLALLWLASYVLNLYETHDSPHGDSHEKSVAARHAPAASTTHGSEAGHEEPSPSQTSQGKAVAGHESADSQSDHAAETQVNQKSKDLHASAADDHQTDSAEEDHSIAAEGAHAPAVSDDAHADTQADSGHDAAAKDTHAAADHGDAQKDTHADTGHGTAEKDAHAVAGHADTHGDASTGHGGGHASIPVSDIKGVTFVMATIAPLKYELEERFYGWRPNDVIRPTDNTENFQLGVLEVTRRTVEVLSDHMSRTGSAQAYDTNLEKARNNLMINAEDYMMPSAESSYIEALEALERYKAKLENGQANFFSRSANLIPLLEGFQHLLGSCDDNLVKYKEETGSAVSWFQADDYFFYAQGVASAMHTVLQAVAVDFAKVIETRRGEDVLHHAIEALHHGMVIDPLIILDGDPDGFTANHRANLAAPISHARFYVSLLIQTLST